MNTYSLYDLDTGLFTGVTIMSSPDVLRLNVPDGCGCLLGAYDQLSQRVVIETGEVIDYQPPQPSPQHQWDVETKRWVYVPTALETCRKNRRMAYPPLEELADALYWQAQGDGAPMLAYLDRCAAVKVMYPKPRSQAQQLP